MTKQYNMTFHCPNCKTWNTAETMFGRWIRANEQLDSRDGLTVSDQDYWIHKYKIYGNREFQLIMLVEVKTMDASLSESQRDTLHVVNQIMRNRRKTPTKDIKYQSGNSPIIVYSTMLKRKVNLRAYGMHVLKFSGMGPDDSQYISWDNQSITETQLTSILRFDLDPDTLTPLDLRNHHLTHENQNLALDLEVKPT